MKKILVPTDFTEEADNALASAYSLAKKSDAEILLLHVIEDPHMNLMKITGETHADSMEKVFVMKLIEKTKEKLNAIVKDKKYKDVNITYKLKIGNPYVTISESITKYGSSLVVMGTKGATGLQELLVGSVADKVVRYASCPVITVKKCRDLSEVKDIVFATDLKDDQITIVDDLKLLQEFYGAKLHIITVYDSVWLTNEEVEKRMNDFASKAGLKNYTVTVIDEMDDAYAILKYARKNDSDMIALGAHDRHGLLHLLAGHVSKDVVNHAKRPIWTMSIK